METLFTTVRDTLQYRGREGQWLWVLHRISGLGVLLFLVVHVLDGALAYFNVPLHEVLIAVYKTTFFSFLEIILAGLLVFHAVNGVRVALLDLRPDLWSKQQLATRLSLIITAILLAPTVIIMIIYTINANFGPAAAAAVR